MRTSERKNRQWMVFVCLAITTVLFLSIGPTLVLGKEKPFPSKPIELMVPFGPGGGIDIGSRILSDSLSKELGVAMVIRNKAGAGGLIAATEYSRLRPDGYTVLVCSGGPVISTVLVSKKPAFDVRKDFLPVGYVGASPSVVTVHKESPFKTYADFVKFAKANPGKLNGGFSGTGGGNHIMMEALIHYSGIKASTVPYTSSGDHIAAVLGKHVDFSIATVASRMPYIKSGDLVPILVTDKTPLLPDVPTGTEVGLSKVSYSTWLGFFVHSKTPKDRYDKLVSAVKVAVHAPGVTDLLTKRGFVVGYKGPKEFSERINRDWEICAEILDLIGMKGKK